MSISTGGPEAAAAARQTISRKPGAYIKDPVRYKTQICQNFVNRGKCPYNKKCQFAHGSEELRSRPEPVAAGSGASPSLLPLLPPPPPKTPTLVASVQPPLPPPLPTTHATMLPMMPPLPPASPRAFAVSPAIRNMEAPFSMMALQLQATRVYGAAAPPSTEPASPAALALPAELTAPTDPDSHVVAAALAVPAVPAAAPPFSLDTCLDVLESCPTCLDNLESCRDEDENVNDLLRLDHVTGRVEIEMPWCGREPSFMTESVRRQISFLFDEPSPKPGFQGRKDPVLQDATWALNWAGTSRAATAA